ncbi:MAG: tetratricopeptide repeat-containing sensor histidine kinase [Methylococcales bacterium]|nr:tetratricopeptide repeat-containing sensor histidine kinase [Methylococcales bacterium]
MKNNSASKKEYLAKKAYKKAIKLKDKGLYERAAREHLKVSKLSLDSEDIARCLYNAGSCYQELHKLDKAKVYYQQALAIQRKTLNENDPHLAKSLNNLGVVYRDRNQFDKAEEYCEQALAIQRKTLDKNDPHLAKFLNNLGAIYHDKGQFDKAEGYYQQAKDISEKSPFPNDELITDNLSVLEQKVARLEHENLELKAGTHQADRLAYLGRMATMMAHNIKNPVNNIATATVSMKMGIKSHKITEEQQLVSLDRISNNCNRLNQTIEHFRDFAQADTTECTSLELNTTLEDIYQLLFAGQYQTDGIECKKDYCKTSPIAYSNSFSLQEILTTLLNNAKEALRDQDIKKVKISTWKKDDKVGFNIEDNGGGIDDKENKLFTPFFSSKKSGMGLGLYSCKQLIEDSNGIIEYYNAPEGAGFRITLHTKTETENGT